MPLVSQVHVDRPLTILSVAYMAALDGILSDKLFPVVPVMKQSDTYFTYDQGDFNRAQAGIRTPGSEPNYGDYDIGTATPYFTKNYEKSKIISDEERGNSDQPLGPDQDALSFVTRAVALTKEVDFASKFFTTGVWATNKVGGTDFVAWDSPVSDPAADVTTWKRGVQEATTGYTPNVLAIGAPVFDKLKVHPGVRDAIKYTQRGFAGDITPALLAGYFGVDEVIVGEVSYVTSPKGAATTTKAQIYGKSALLVYRTKTPSLRSITGGLTMAWDGGTGLARDGKGLVIRRWREDARMGDAIQCMGYWDHKVVSSDAGLFASAVVS